MQGYVVQCSCGQTTTICFDPTVDDFVPQDSSWSFDTISDGTGRGWNCGQAGHHTVLIDHSNNSQITKEAFAPPRSAPIKPPPKDEDFLF